MSCHSTEVVIYIYMFYCKRLRLWGPLMWSALLVSIIGGCGHTSGVNTIKSPEWTVGAILNHHMILSTHGGRATLY